MAQTVLDAAALYRKQLLAQERASAVRLVQAYGQLYKRLQDSIAALTEQLAQMENPTRGKLQKLAAWRALKAQIEERVGQFGYVADAELDQSARAALQAGLEHWQKLTELSIPEAARASIMGSFALLNTDAVETLLGFLADDSPLHAALTQKLGPAVAQAVEDRLVQGLVLGNNPRATAAAIRTQLGQGLTWSLQTTRTATLWAYREAQRAAQVANQHIAPRWVWSAALDGRTCGSCWAMHGTIHPAAEPLNDHYCGRCARIPLTVSWQELGIDLPELDLGLEMGEAAFKRLTAAEQKAILGPGKWAWWQAGGDFAKLSVQRPVDVYGSMRFEATLQELEQ